MHCSLCLHSLTTWRCALRVHSLTTIMTLSMARHHIRVMPQRNQHARSIVHLVLHTARYCIVFLKCMLVSINHGILYRCYILHSSIYSVPGYGDSDGVVSTVRYLREVRCAFSETIDGSFAATVMSLLRFSFCVAFSRGERPVSPTSSLRIKIKHGRLAWID